MKQKGASDVKGSLWNHLDKNVLLWHLEAPLFLRVYYQQTSRLNLKIGSEHKPGALISELEHDSLKL